MQKEFENFFSEVIEALNLKSLPKNSQEQIISDLGGNMLEEIIVSSLELMSENDREELIRIESEGETEKIVTFLNSKIPNFKEFAKERARKVVDEFLSALNAK